MTLDSNAFWRTIYFYEFINVATREYELIHENSPERVGEPPTKKRKVEQDSFFTLNTSKDWRELSGFRYRLRQLNHTSLEAFPLLIYKNPHMLTNISKHAKIQQGAQENALEILTTQYCKIRTARSIILSSPPCLGNRTWTNMFNHHVYFFAAFHWNATNGYSYDVELMNKVVIFHPVTGIPVIVETAFKSYGPRGTQDDEFQICFSDNLEKNSLLYSCHGFGFEAITRQMYSLFGERVVRSHRFKRNDQNVFNYDTNSMEMLFSDPMIDERQSDELSNVNELFRCIAFVFEPDYDILD
jgi:hypothetical protein